MRYDLLRKAALALSVILLSAGAVLMYRGLVPETAAPAVGIPCQDVVAGCALPEHGLRVRFDHAAAPMKPFRLEVEAGGAQEVYASFMMHDMQMGMNRYRLRREASGLWAADIVLPICADGRSDWVMTLEVDKRRYQLRFIAG